MLAWSPIGQDCLPALFALSGYSAREVIIIIIIIIKNECHSNIIVDSFDPSDVDRTSRMCVVCIARGAIDVRRKSDNILCYVCQNTATHELNMLGKR